MKELLNEQQEWFRLRDIIDCKESNKYYPDGNWIKIVNLFEEGFEKRYFNPLNRILEDPAKMGEGYLIVTMQCVLIEAFSTYPLGLNYCHTEDENLRAFQYNSSSALFKEFLESDELFNTTNNSLKSYYRGKSYNFSDDFYRNVRSSLVHSARLKNNWIVQSGDLENDDVFVKIEGEVKIIYRDILQGKLLKFFKKYIDDLKNSDAVFDFQRTALCRKLDNIYGTEFDRTVNWWNPKAV